MPFRRAWDGLRASAVGPGAGFEPLEREGTRYAARLRSPLVVQTPALLVADLEQVGARTFARLRVSPDFAEFAENAEDAVLRACLEHKASLFRKEWDDEQLRAMFARLVSRGDDLENLLRVEILPGAVVYDSAGRASGDDVEAGEVRAILELTRITFGKNKFGARWEVVAVQKVETPFFPEEPSDDEASQDGPDDPDEPDFP